MRRGRPGCSRRASSARSTHAVLPQPVGTSTASGMSPATSLAWSRSCQGQGSWPATSRKCATALPSPCRRALIAPCSSAVAGPRYAPLGPPRRRADSLRALPAVAPDAPLLQASFISGFLLPVRLVLLSSPALDSARVGGASSVGVPRGCSARWWVRLGDYAPLGHRGDARIRCVRCTLRRPTHLCSRPLSSPVFSSPSASSSRPLPPLTPPASAAHLRWASPAGAARDGGCGWAMMVDRYRPRRRGLFGSGQCC